MKIATLCFLIKGDEVCLAMKKRGFGAGKYNGFGGKVGDKDEFKNETIEESLTREGREEFGIEIKEVEKCGVIDFRFPQNPEWGGQTVHCFICKDWQGEPQESEEMKPEWFKISEIPYEKMWDDDKYWLPRVLNGEVINGEFEFNKEGIVIKQEIKIARGTPERKMI